MLSNKEAIDSLNQISKNLEDINDTLKTEKEEAKLIITEDDFEKAQDTLLGYYTELQSSQGTRLIGFVAGLFTLLQLAQYSGDATHAFNLNFPSIPADFKVIILFLGCSIILYFILRTIFRYSLFGFLPSKIITARKKDAEKVLRDWIENEDLKGKEPTSSALYALNTSIFRKIHEKEKVFGIKSYYFYSVLDPKTEYQANEFTGEVGLAVLAVVFSVLLILFLW